MNLKCRAQDGVLQGIGPETSIQSRLISAQHEDMLASKQWVQVLQPRPRPGYTELSSSRPIQSGSNSNFNIAFIFISSQLTNQLLTPLTDEVAYNSV